MIYQRCTRCVLEASPLSGLKFDENGVCNNCNNFDLFVKKNRVFDWDLNKIKLEEKVNEIKKAGKKNKYDCILGISGGVDSTYLAYLSRELGLRPLVVHFDNGWNSELSVQNIHNIVKKLDLNLFTYVIDWNEFRDLQLAYLKASVVDIEVPTDHFIYATLQEVANKNNIKYILDGNNIATEYWGGSMTWGFAKLDLVNLQNIHKKFGTIPLKKYPKLGIYQRYYYQNVRGISSAYLINYVPYIKKDILKLIEKELGWRDPGGKHYESIFTRFYQGYILPRKFGIDKRLYHYSNLIWTDQMTREEALAKIAEPTYPLELQMQDKEFVSKKFGLTEIEFENIMNLPVVKHETFGTDKELDKQYYYFKKIADPAVRILKRLKLI